VRHFGFSLCYRFFPVFTTVIITVITIVRATVRALGRAKGITKNCLIVFTTASATVFATDITIVIITVIPKKTGLPLGLK